MPGIARHGVDPDSLRTAVEAVEACPSLGYRSVVTVSEDGLVLFELFRWSATVWLRCEPSGVVEMTGVAAQEDFGPELHRPGGLAGVMAGMFPAEAVLG